MPDGRQCHFPGRLFGIPGDRDILLRADAKACRSAKAGPVVLCCDGGELNQSGEDCDQSVLATNEIHHRNDPFTG